MSDKLLIAKTPAEINFWHLAALRGALRLEKVGMKRRGRSALSVAKQEFGLKPRASHDDAIAAVQAEIDRQLAEKARG
jgi:hypothetical protein